MRWDVGGGIRRGVLHTPENEFIVNSVGAGPFCHLTKEGQSLESFLQIPIYIIYEISQNDVNKK